MESATIAVLAMTGVFLGFYVWIERHSRSQERPPKSSESVDDRLELRKTAAETETEEELMKGGPTKPNNTIVSFVGVNEGTNQPPPQRS